MIYLCDYEEENYPFSIWFMDNPNGFCIDFV